VQQTISARSLADAQIVDTLRTSGRTRRKGLTDRHAAPSPPTRRSSRRCGIRMPQTQRNRELGLLLFAFLINASAVALVQLGATGHRLDVPVLLRRPHGARPGLHIVLRYRAPQADPFVVPIATVLSGLGLAMIYRIDIEDGDRAGRVLDPPARVARDRDRRGRRDRHRSPQLPRALRYTYVFGFAGILLLLCRSCRASAPIRTRTSGSRSAGLLVPAGRARQDLPRDLLRRLPRAHARSADLRRHALPRHDVARPRELGPPAALGRRDGDHRAAARPRHGMLIFGMFVAMLYVATGKTSWVVIGLTLAAIGVAAATSILPYVQARFTNWLYPFDPDTVDGSSYQLVSGIFGLARAACSAPVSAGPAGPHPCRRATTSSRASAKSSDSSASSRSSACTWCSRAAASASASRAGRLRQAPRDGPVVHDRAAGVHHGRRRHPLIPLTGLTTPFLAAGGSSLIANWIIVALLLRISDAVRSRPGW
jgi:hypothetical protein